MRAFKKATPLPPDSQSRLAKKLAADLINLPQSPLAARRPAGPVTLFMNTFPVRLAFACVEFFFPTPALKLARFDRAS